MQKITTQSETETKTLGKKIATTMTGGQIICLHGELGAGKTTFTKGLAEGLGITETITSPTFTLMNVYKVQSQKSKVQSLVHIDTYRLKDANELLQIGAEDYIGEPNTLTLIEWPEKIKALLQNKKVTNITIDHQTENSRLITITNG
jgi:tRNA threonylcarbamoyladenosine biosynthesis protein TsaE